MSAVKWLLGSSVFLAAVVAFVISTHVVNAAFAAEDGHHKKTAAEGGHHKKTAGRKPTEASQPGIPANAAAEGGKNCTDMNGKPFGWDWPNVPFGTSSCR